MDHRKKQIRLTASRANGPLHGAGVSLLSGENPAVYTEMTAEYQRSIGPASPIEPSLVQPIVDAQWRLLRSTRR
jgi:hypothetical protein